MTPMFSLHSVLQTVLDWMVSVPAPVVLLVIGLAVFGEAAFFLGFIIPGETAVLFGGFLAYSKHVPLAALLIVVLLCAVVGDSVGYEVGKRFGPRLMRLRLLAKHEHRLEGARTFLDGRGGFAVVAGRWTAFLRAVMPGLAGMANMRYRKFLFFNAFGGIVWGTVCVVGGYAAGKSYEQVGQWMGRTGAVFVAVLVVAAGLFWHRNRERKAEAEVR
jgi:membrane-associated protein